jgi:SAM-dependent methyltransferase
MQTVRISEVIYERIGRGYGNFRRTDPRIAARVGAALGDARTVVNVGAGTGSYEPVDRDVTAVEPSRLMIAQRPPGSAPAVRASAEQLPFEDDSFDAAMAINTDHHWSDRAGGLREMRRVARHRVVLVNADPALARRFWLTRDYLPGYVSLTPEPSRKDGHWRRELRHLLGEVEIEPLPVPHDCLDGFYQAYWRRPHAYLDPHVRDSISVFPRLPEGEVAGAIELLRRDLDDGTWEERHGQILSLSELDIDLRLVTAVP